MSAHYQITNVTKINQNLASWKVTLRDLSVPLGLWHLSKMLYKEFSFRGSSQAGTGSPLSKLPRAPTGKLELDTSSPREPPDLFIRSQSVPLLCKVLLTARLHNCEPFMGRCFSDLYAPKELSFGVDEDISHFYKFDNTKNTKDVGEFQQRWHKFQRDEQSNCAQPQLRQVNWPYKASERSPSR